jgi:peptidoglycan/xylan/chitin deacetylase (PgdA/CDA1 family)
MARLAVLMYHNFTLNENESKGLTISATKFEEQIKYLVSKKYQFLFASELGTLNKISSKSIAITFDDVTVNQLEIALPILLKYNIKATFYIPFGYLGKTDEWNKNEDYNGNQIMTISQLKTLPSSIELGFHSYRHRHYSNLSVEEINLDFEECFKIIKENNLDVKPTLAFPFGSFPKEKQQQNDFFSALSKNGIQLAFRIGNRLNKFPFKNKFLLKRIDIKGEESLFKFKLKLKFGKLKLF